MLILLEKNKIFKILIQKRKMKRLSILLVIATVVFGNNVCLAESPTPVSLPFESYNTSNPKELFKQLQEMTGISEEEFCKCFPSLCCECGKKQYVKENNAPCPPNSHKLKYKICCVGEKEEQRMEWYCCEPEPPCECCPCDLRDCPSPFERGYFYFAMASDNIPPSFVDLVLMVSEVIRKYGGKTCCEEFIQSGEYLHCFDNDN